MNDSIRLGINGASGRMGRALMGLLHDDGRFVLGHAVIDSHSDLVGSPVPACAQSDAPRFATDWQGAPQLDVVIDFSAPAGLTPALAYCEQHGTALVSGTTGIDSDLEQRLAAAGSRIAVLRAANFSLGIAVLTRLLRDAAAALPDWDLEIIEAHHCHKQDAPSGTALALGEAAAAARGVALGDVAAYARHGHTGERTPGSIGFAVVRGGDLAGEHTAMLITSGERVELTHRATNREIFARGALAAAAWLAQRPAGAYGIDDVLADRLAGADTA